VEHALEVRHSVAERQNSLTAYAPSVLNALFGAMISVEGFLIWE
jgi:hypothetical protein